MSALPNVPKISRAIAMTAAALALAGGATITTVDTAHAAPASCSWTREGNDGPIYVKDGNGNWQLAGQIEQQYDYCGNTRAVFYWNNTFRTTAHPGITGAWVESIDESSDNSTIGTNSGWVGSSVESAVPSGPGMYVHTSGVNRWYSIGWLKVAYSSGAVVQCHAWSDEHDYHTGSTVASYTKGWCS